MPIYMDRHIVPGVEAKHAALGARDICIINCERDSDGAYVRFERELPIELPDDIPSIITKFLQPWNSVEQIEEWLETGEGGFKSDMSIDIATMPVTITGTLELKPHDEGCVNEIRLSVDCSIPFVGKPLANFVGTDCKRLIAAEYEYITERLQRS